jgi:hypothetical protein
MKIIGLVLIGLGIIGILYGGITYTKREKIIDIGDLEASVDTKERIPLPPVAGGLAILAGAILIVMDRRRAA